MNLQRWQTNCNGRERSLDLTHASVMGILNVTPDSFSDGGDHSNVDDALTAAERMLAAGAAVLDIGGESTRPGSVPVNAAEQIRRVVPAIRSIRARLGDSFLITIDTTLEAVAAAAFDEGADAVNDTSAARDDAATFETVARRGAGLILMHRLTLPSRDAYSTQYSNTQKTTPIYEPDVVSVVSSFLAERAKSAEAAGIPHERIMLDPGLGFGKSVEDNLRLIRGTPTLASLGYPILSGLSRKSFVGHVSGVSSDHPAKERLSGTIALSIEHYRMGARLFRVHDVAEVVQALRAAEACDSVLS